MNHPLATEFGLNLFFVVFEYEKAIPKRGATDYDLAARAMAMLMYCYDLMEEVCAK